MDDCNLSSKIKQAKSINIKALQSILEESDGIGRRPKPKSVRNKMPNGSVEETLYGVISERVTSQIVEQLDGCPYITASIAAALSGTSQVSIREWAKKNEFSSVCVGGEARYLKIGTESFRRWLIKQGIVVPGFTAEKVATHQKRIVVNRPLKDMDELAAESAIKRLANILVNRKNKAPEKLQELVEYINALVC